MKQYILLSIFVSLISGLSAQQTITKSILHDGIEREYILYIPANYTGDEEVPIIFNFHGFGGNAQSQMEYGDFRMISDTAGFIIAHPQGTLFNGVPHWNVGGWTVGSTTDDVGFIDALLDTISDNYNINLSRVYSTGMSNGGFFSFLLACQLSDRITAIASVTGSMTPETYNFCFPQHPTAILQFHGTFDIVVPYGGADFSKPIDDVIDYWVDFNNCNTSPEIIYLPDIDPNDGSTVEHYRYTEGDNDVVTEHFKVIGGGHTWPGSSGGGAGTNNDINASVEIWKFFLRYQLDINTDITQSNAVKKSIKVFPNPASNLLTIETKNGDQVYYEIVSLLGTIMKKGKLSNKTTSIDIQSIPQGLYFVRVGKVTKRLMIE